MLQILGQTILTECDGVKYIIPANDVKLVKLDNENSLYIYFTSHPLGFLKILDMGKNVEYFKTMKGFYSKNE